MTIETTKLQHALQLAQIGFHVFPLCPNSKVPIENMSYPTMATTDADQIKKWWSNGSGACNIGISTSKFGTDKALLVVDVDMKNDKDGEMTLFTLEMEGKFFPNTLTFLTPTGGRHLIYVVPKPVNQRQAGFLGEGVDIRSRGGYIVAPGSVVAAGQYKMEGTL